MKFKRLFDIKEEADGLISLSLHREDWDILLKTVKYNELGDDRLQQAMQCLWEKING